MKANENEKQRGLKRAEVREKQLGCFNGEARVLLADGSVKEAHQVHAGDCIACDIDCATSAVVIGRYVQSAGVRREVLRLCSGRLAISNSHRVKLCGRWMKPGDAADAERDSTFCGALYNFILDGRQPFVVEGMVVSSVGQYCEGAHDLTKPTHRLWTSEHIVRVFRSHPMWPDIQLPLNDRLLPMLKDPACAEVFLSVIEKLWCRSRCKSGGRRIRGNEAKAASDVQDDVIQV